MPRFVVIASPAAAPNRRDVLRWLAGAGLAGLTGCVGDVRRSHFDSEVDASLDDAPDAPESPEVAAQDVVAPLADVTAPAEVAGPDSGEGPEAWAWGGTAAMTAKAGYPDPHVVALTGCEHIVPSTAGPCTTALQLVREDISDGLGGLPVRLSLRVIDAACAPRSGVTVRVWHTTPDGSYTGQTPNNRICVRIPALAASNAGRGAGPTGSDGVVAFDTCFPGWYPGRAIHIHFEVRDGDTSFGISQLYFPEDVTAGIFASHPEYARFGQPDTDFATDGVLRAVPVDKRGLHLLEVARMDDGVMLASKTLVVG